MRKNTTHAIHETEEWARTFVMDVCKADNIPSSIESNTRKHFDESIDRHCREVVISALRCKGVEYKAIGQRLAASHMQPGRWEKYDEGDPRGKKLAWENIWRTVAAFNISIARLGIPKGHMLVAYACRECMRWIRHELLNEPCPRPNLLELEVLYQTKKDYWLEAVKSKSGRKRELAMARIQKAVKKRTGKPCPFNEIREIENVCKEWDKPWALLLVNVPTYTDWEY